ncbi:hypothetical protein P280DRAFT_214892 [Massarina eburnea CBS 473.64]|uniref:Membrane anchor Opy2 N-terminal domain-containing protein n=1 Tax=Massarina eburnea CBS 473.64 TaxID=1395130 RepID=A0A6A6SAC3_9PLEO|nr:hypothetical protein P280DRAFT_214892 [Massarina eburnea CBS 473.64]
MAAFTQRGKDAPPRCSPASSANVSAAETEKVMRSVFKRCVQCDTAAPSCAGLDCAKGMMCIQTPPTCDSCATVSCQRDPSADDSADAASPNVGAIAGGAVGGAVFLAIVLFLVWKFCLKGRRQRIQEAQWQEDVDMQTTQEKTVNEIASQRSTRASTYTVASMASSVLTRASNIIQIAYIPGVTNRSGPGSPDVLVPPVPPIPAMTPSSRMTGYSEQHFFVPDFRNSTASGSTDASFAQGSIAPSLARASVASTVYRQNAIVSPLPAQTIVRGKAAVVSVKSSGSNSPTDSPIMDSLTPPVPAIEAKHVKPVRIQMPQQTGSKLSPQNSVRSTATLGKVRALNITKKKEKEKANDVTPPKSSSSDQDELVDSSSTSATTLVATPSPDRRPLTEVSMASTDDGIAHGRARRAGDLESDSESDDDDDHARARHSMIRDDDLSNSPTSTKSPFSDANSSIASFEQRPGMEKRYTNSSIGLQPPMTPIMEESKRASDSSKRTQSPFSDENKSDLK